MSTTSTAPGQHADELAVSMRGVSKSFDGVSVLKNVDFELRRGEVHALVGGNGAGKSTLMKILQGVHTLDHGQIHLQGRPVHLASTLHARAAGIGMVFQEFSLVPTLTAAQNVFLASEPRSRLGLLRDSESSRRTRQVFQEMGVEIDPDAPMNSLSTAYWQLTEIAKALAQDAQVLIMDEPTASLAKHEATALFDLVERLKARRISIIYISHRMDEIYRIADRVTVLRDGAHVLTAPVAELTSDHLVEAIVGRKMEDTFTWQQRSLPPDAEVLLEARRLNAGRRVRDVSFRLRQGEILGLAGLMGSGRTELTRCIFGIDGLDSGQILVHGQPVDVGKPERAMAAGIALIPENRRDQGLVLDHSVHDNLLLPLLSRLRRGPILNNREGRRVARSLIDRFAIKVSDASRPVRLLSGGNQQKVVIAKWLGSDPDVLILDEPTAGVDIGTKTEILDMIRALADAGKGIILISSELPELLAVSDRVLVLRAGAVDRELSRAEIPDEESLQLAVQGV